MWSRQKLQNEAEFKTRAGEIYAEYCDALQASVQMAAAVAVHQVDLQKDLRSDAHALFGVLRKARRLGSANETKARVLYSIC